MGYLGISTSIEEPSTSVADNGYGTDNYNINAKQLEVAAQLQFDTAKYRDNNVITCPFSVKTHGFLSLASAHNAEIAKHQLRYS